MINRDNPRPWGASEQEALDFLARSMRAGHAFSISLEMLGTEQPDPLGQEFRALFAEHPADRVEHVGFSAPIRPDDARHAGVEVEDGLRGEGLETEDFEALTRAVLDVAKVHSAGRVVSVLEGGYNPARLAESAGLHLQTLLNFPTTSAP